MTMRSLQTLPKAHLHLHLEAGMRAATLEELAALHGIRLPELGRYADFTMFEEVYGAATAVLVTGRDVRRLVREVVEDARSDGATYIEPALYTPPYRPHFGHDEAIVELVLDELRQASKDLGVSTGLMISGDRTFPVAECEEQADLAARFAGRGVVSFGLAGDERGYPCDPFARAFAIAREAGLLSTPHAGELDGPRSIRAALDLLGADRIQHGGTALDDPELVTRLADDGVCLDVCPTSNLVMGVIERIEDHPIGRLLEAGVRCTINADDPLLFGPGLLDEFELCRTRLGLTDPQLADAALASFECSGAQPEVVAGNRAAIGAWLATA